MVASSEEKMSDKVFWQNLLISILSILLCIVSLCSVTYAWFSEGVSSSNNSIESGFFALDVVVKDGNGKVLDMTKNEDGSVSCLMENIGDYTVELGITGDTTASKGFCIITSGEMKKNTEPISRDSKIATTSITFKITSNEENVTVSFYSSWGIPAVTDVVNDGALAIGNQQNAGE